MFTFEEIGLSRYVIQAIYGMGFETPTTIQEKAVPPAIKGQDLIGQAQTGTGKTAAFGIPMVEKIDAAKGSIQGLVITPTRELAVQVATEINTIGQYKGVRALPVFGGQDINRQIKALKKKPQVIVGTPGRLMDHMMRKTIRLASVTVAVLDEADEMLNMGFIEDIETIMHEVPEQRQTLLFSATIPKSIQDLAQRFMKEPQVLKTRPKEVTVSNTEQFYIEVSERQKFDVLCRILDLQSPDMAIVFGRTKRRVDELNEALNKRGYSAEGIHGDLTQARRDSVMHNFKQANTELLVATDVAARGLDIGGVTHVYNFDIPQDPDSYVHRIGRTGRLGKTGMAITLVTPREITHLRTIESSIKRKIKRQPIPTMSEVMEGQSRLTLEKLRQVVKEEDLRPYYEAAESLLEEIDSVSLLSAALKILTREPDSTPVSLTEERPQQKNKKHARGKEEFYRKHDKKSKGGKGKRRNYYRDDRKR